MCGADIEASRGVVCFLNDRPFLSTYVNVVSFTTLKVRPSPNPLLQSWQLHIINAECRPRRAIKVGFFCVLEQSGTVTEHICTKLKLLDRFAWGTPNLNFMNIRQGGLVCFTSLHVDGRTDESSPHIRSFFLCFLKNAKISVHTLQRKPRFYYKNNLFRERRAVYFENSITAWSGVLLEKLTVPQLVKNFPTFTEPEGSQPPPQPPATCPYPEPD